ncbi:hypothetical protein [Sulfuricurvum sp.]|uniref:hypothetical protein n=1 Tax=Sulfuricurvum sp. TaxID=2025608 RepID=UPI002639E3E8|nr:hypothetical protein [Sulfuricurvum sp.]MDD3597865.1 hypothetical protein [Sulfuricurvum sp.]
MHSRSAMAMIELIFAIVIIAISVITIPTMMSIAGESAKGALIDDDVIARLSAQTIDKFQARWGGEYDVNSTREPKAYISNLSSVSDLNCSRTLGALYYRANPDSSMECNVSQIPLAIPSTAGNGVGDANGSVEWGLEMLNGGTETLSVTSSTGESIDINATYNVRYVSAAIVQNGNTETATWTLGSSGTIGNDNGGQLGTVEADRTHLKRVVVRFWNNALNIDNTMTFFKSNQGSF